MKFESYHIKYDAQHDMIGMRVYDNGYYRKCLRIELG